MGLLQEERDLRQPCAVSSFLLHSAKNVVDVKQYENIPTRNKRFNVNIIFRLWHIYLIEKWHYSHKKIFISFSESQKNITLTTKIRLNRRRRLVLIMNTKFGWWRRETVACALLFFVGNFSINLTTGRFSRIH